MPDLEEVEEFARQINAGKTSTASTASKRPIITEIDSRKELEDSKKKSGEEKEKVI
jgi:hypothetical protein